MTKFAIVGTGWRAEYFWRLGGALTGLDCVGVVSRRRQRELPVPVYTSLDECLERKPDFVVTSVPWAVTPTLVTELVERGLRVLAETPPAPDLDGLRRLWHAVGASGLVQVAEQYTRMPAHAARLALVRSGVLGTPTRVDVSSTHQYHAVSLIRTFLGIGRGPVEVRATRTTAPLADPLDRAGWTDPVEVRPATTTVATLAFDGGGFGLYDFTDNQWHNQLLMRRLLVRGTSGELRDQECVRLVADRTIVTTQLVRRQTGYDLDLDGFDTDHISFGDQVLYRNPYQGQRWNDEEVAIATLLEDTAAWVDGGPQPYPLADGIHDHRVALAFDEAAERDAAVRVPGEPWA
ncbi:Gfo/Idh/MocA family protein [Actinophytocola oryzae]|uniref:Putative dehydrogenase n=1 Tax=Actinophytocola oryzae TaxID=502181 RepID=A0A4R7VXM5_9PSEU|nr:Gfo/Idh/MocA family oxidoreductase [Actinophytocola oryzae]TDV54896.1 putative dehydrogenase [Actinophytocola oryzae]